MSGFDVRDLTNEPMSEYTNKQVNSPGGLS